MKKITGNFSVMKLLAFLLNTIGFILHKIFPNSKQTEETLLFTIYVTASFYFVFIGMNNFINNKYEVWSMRNKELRN